VKETERDGPKMRTFAHITLLCAAVLGAAAGCSTEEEERELTRLARLVVEIRQVELETLTRKVDPESLNLVERIKRFEVSIHDTHKNFEQQVEWYEKANRELGEEISDLEVQIRQMKPRYKGRFPSLGDAEKRRWTVRRELERVRSLSWRKR
jgi:hypothetical protein